MAGDQRPSLRHSAALQPGLVSPNLTQTGHKLLVTLSSPLQPICPSHTKGNKSKQQLTRKRCGFSFVTGLQVQNAAVYKLLSIINSIMNFYLKQKQDTSHRVVLIAVSKFCVTKRKKKQNPKQHTHKQYLHLKMWALLLRKKYFDCIITRYWFLGPCKSVLKKKQISTYLNLCLKPTPVPTEYEQAQLLQTRFSLQEQILKLV